MKKQLKIFFERDEHVAIEIRKGLLRSLGSVVKSYETDISAALQKEGGRGAYEIYTQELSPVYNEIDYFIKNLDILTEEKKQSLLTTLGVKSKKKYIPRGIGIIIGDASCPLVSLLIPLVGSIAAGNRCIVVLPEEVPEVSEVICDIINTVFGSEEVLCMQNKKAIVRKIMQEQVAYMIVTGGYYEHQEIWSIAREYGISCFLYTLGNNPCFIDSNVPIQELARTLVGLQLRNGGQGIHAPKHMIVHEKIYETFMDEYRKALDTYKKEYKYWLVSDDRFKRCKKFLKTADIVYGGEIKEKEQQIYPTVVTYNGKMDEMIVEGPIITVDTFSNYKEAEQKINRLDHVIRVYIFSNNPGIQEYFGMTLRSPEIFMNNAQIGYVDRDYGIAGSFASGNRYYYGRRSFELLSYEQVIVEGEGLMGIPSQLSSTSRSVVQYFKKKLGRKNGRNTK